MVELEGLKELKDQILREVMKELSAYLGPLVRCMMQCAKTEVHVLDTVYSFSPRDSEDDALYKFESLLTEIKSLYDAIDTFTRELSCRPLAEGIIESFKRALAEFFKPSMSWAIASGLEHYRKFLECDKFINITLAVLGKELARELVDEGLIVKQFGPEGLKNWRLAIEGGGGREKEGG